MYIQQVATLQLQACLALPISTTVLVRSWPSPGLADRIWVLTRNQGLTDQGQARPPRPPAASRRHSAVPWLCPVACCWLLARAAIATMQASAPAFTPATEQRLRPKKKTTRRPRIQQKPSAAAAAAHESERRPPLPADDARHTRQVPAPASAGPAPKKNKLPRGTAVGSSAGQPQPQRKQQSHQTKKTGAGGSKGRKRRGGSNSAAAVAQACLASWRLATGDAVGAAGQPHTWRRLELWTASATSAPDSALRASLGRYALVVEAGGGGGGVLDQQGQPAAAVATVVEGGGKAAGGSARAGPAAQASEAAAAAGVGCCILTIRVAPPVRSCWHHHHRAHAASTSSAPRNGTDRRQRAHWRRGRRCRRCIQRRRSGSSGSSEELEPPPHDPKNPRAAAAAAAETVTLRRRCQECLPRATRRHWHSRLSSRRRWRGEPGVSILYVVHFDCEFPVSRLFLSRNRLHRVVVPPIGCSPRSGYPLVEAARLAVRSCVLALATCGRICFHAVCMHPRVRCL
jgi:hypothetical protein